MPAKQKKPRHPLAEAIEKVVPVCSTDGQYLVGVSGGCDSVSLLHALHTHGFKNLIVCHLDHGLRGAAARADALFVKRLAQELGCGHVGRKLDVAALAEKKRLSIETAARDARYEFFAHAARRKSARGIFLAHHADDQVETVLFNLFRGTGTNGLAGMGVVTPRRIGAHTLQVIRPLLGVWRAEIEDYARAHALEFREDESNRSLANTRSVMRHEIIPSIERALGRRIRRQVWQTAGIVRGQVELLEEFLAAAPEEILVADLRAMDANRRRLHLFRWLKGRGVRAVTHEVVERVATLLEVPPRVAKVNLPRGRFARRRAGRIFLE